MGLLAVFFAFLALAASQCDIEYTQWTGNYAVVAEGDSAFTLTFGQAVGDWVPGVEYNDEDSVIFVSWATDSGHVVMKDWGSIANEDCEDVEGAYRISFSSDCKTARVSLSGDQCVDRAAQWGSVTLRLVEDEGEGEEAECMTIHEPSHGVFGVSHENPRFSGQQVAFVSATDPYVIASVSDRGALWMAVTPDELNTDLVVVLDVASAPRGLACDPRHVGDYQIVHETEEGAVVNECSFAYCGTADSCEARAELMHGLTVGDYNGPLCSSEVNTSPFSLTSGACSDGKPWQRSAWECIDQNSGDQCMFCRGIGNGVEVALCLDRNGGNCVDIFENPASVAWCNLEFECPAVSQFGFSLLFVVVLVLSTLF